MSAQPAANRWLKLAACLSFLLIAAALLLIERHSPATGYELSIYSSLPAAAWVCLIGAIAGGTGITVHQAFAHQKGRLWVLGFCILALAAFGFLILPVLRGYHLYGSSDTVSHVRWSQEIIRLGRFWEGDQYPITHILVAQLSQASGAAPEMVAKWVPAFFSVLFMLFSYLLAASVMPRRGQAMLVAACTALFFNYYHVCVYPQTLSITMLPLLFYLYFKSSGRAAIPFRVGFMMLLFLFPYFHPAPAAVLVASLMGAEIGKVLWKMRARTSPPTAAYASEGVTVEPTLISSVAFLTWISTHAIFDKTIWNTLGWLTGEIESIPRAAELEHVFSGAGLSLADQVLLALKMYGDNVVYLSLCMIALLIVARRFLGRRSEVRKLAILSMPFLVSGPVWVLIFATTMSVTIGRLLGSNVMMWATPVFAAFALYEIFARWKRARVMAVTAILLGASVMGTVAVYHSPYILQASWHVTEQDIQGSRWLLGRASTQVHRLQYSNLGLPFVFVGRVRIPDHFGYQRQQTLGASLDRDALVVLTERTRQTVADPVLRDLRISDPRIKLVATDFQRLEQDPTISRLYLSGEIEVLKVDSPSGGP